MNEPIQITDASGYIVDKAVRDAYERICGAEVRWSAVDRTRSAEAFLGLVERYAAKGARLV